MVGPLSMQKSNPQNEPAAPDGIKAAAAASTAPPAVASPMQPANPEEFARNMLRVMEDGAKFYTTLLQRTEPRGKQGGASTELFDASKTLAELSQAWMSDPGKFAEAQGELYKGYLELWNGTMRRLMGETVVPVAKPEPGDNRFKDAEWAANPYFDYWKQAYLISTKWAEQMLAQTPGLDDKTRAKADFLLRQIAASLSPTNFPVMNPEVLRETMASNGRNLVEGMAQLQADMERSGPVLKISQTDTTAFQVGRDLAVSPGKVIYQNDILQLIQYAPSTETVHTVPLLIVRASRRQERGARRTQRPLLCRRALPRAPRPEPPVRAHPLAAGALDRGAGHRAAAQHAHVRGVAPEKRARRADALPLPRAPASTRRPLAERRRDGRRAPRDPRRSLSRSVSGDAHEADVARHVAFRRSPPGHLDVCGVDVGAQRARADRRRRSRPGDMRRVAPLHVVPEEEPEPERARDDEPERQRLGQRLEPVL